MKKLLCLALALGGLGTAAWSVRAGVPRTMDGDNGRFLAAALLVSMSGLIGLAVEFLRRSDRRPLRLRAADKVEDVFGRLSRAVLVLGVLAVGAAGAGAVALFWPVSGVVAAVLVVGYVCKAKAPSLWAMGTGRWASFRDMGGMIGGDKGLILGLLARRPTLGQALRALLFWPARKSAVAVALFLGALRLGPRPVVRLPQACHILVCAPSAAGKSTGLVIPFLLDCPDSCVVLDYKGELAKATAAHRRRAFGHRVVLIDPYHLVTKRPDTFNTLASIRADDPAALDFCRDVAEALVVRTGEEKEPHWNDSAEEWIAAIVAAVVAFGPPGDRSLQTVKEILSEPKLIKRAIDLMCRSDHWGGLLARMGSGLQHYVERELGSVLTTANRHLRFLSTPAMTEATSASTFDPRDLKNGKGRMTTYVAIPFEHARPLAGYQRLLISSFMRAVVQGGPDEKTLVHFVLDEAAGLSRLQSIDDALSRYRGHGVRLQLYYQALGQLQTCFPEGQAETVLANTTQVFFGTVDLNTANYISQRCGSETIQVANTQKQTSYSYSGTNFGEPPHPPQYSTSESTGWNQQARELLKPDEILRLPKSKVIAFPSAMPPVVADLQPYFSARWMRRRGVLGRFTAGVGTLLKAAALLAVVAALAGLLVTAQLDREANQARAPFEAAPFAAPAQTQKKQAPAASPGKTINQWR